MALAHEIVTDNTIAALDPVAWIPEDRYLARCVDPMSLEGDSHMGEVA